MTDKRKLGAIEMIVGAIGAILSAIGVVLSIRSKRWVLSVIFGVTFALSGWVFFTGWQNYAGVMVGVTKVPNIDYQRKNLVKIIESKKIPLIEVADKDELKDLLTRFDKEWLWLPCSKGGEWFKPSAFIITKWNLPKKDLLCPNGRPLIKYTGKNG